MFYAIPSVFMNIIHKIDTKNVSKNFILSVKDCQNELNNFKATFLSSTEQIF